MPASGPQKRILNTHMLFRGVVPLTGLKVQAERQELRLIPDCHCS